MSGNSLYGFFILQLNLVNPVQNMAGEVNFSNVRRAMIDAKDPERFLTLIFGVFV